LEQISNIQNGDVTATETAAPVDGNVNVNVNGGVNVTRVTHTHIPQVKYGKHFPKEHHIRTVQCLKCHKMVKVHKLDFHEKFFCGKDHHEHDRPNRGGGGGGGGGGCQQRRQQFEERLQQLEKANGIEPPSDINNNRQPNVNTVNVPVVKFDFGSCTGRKFYKHQLYERMFKLEELLNVGHSINRNGNQQLEMRLCRLEQAQRVAENKVNDGNNDGFVNVTVTDDDHHSLGTDDVENLKRQLETVATENNSLKTAVRALQEYQRITDNSSSSSTPELEDLKLKMKLAVHEKQLLMQQFQQLSGVMGKDSKVLF
jgi:hypothetical protein